MNLKHILLPSVALGGAAILLLPGISEGFSTIGGLLNYQQRDVRVFNNFTNPGANGNQTPDSNFPGWVQAEMAIWKSVVEWGSQLHGTGNGDPHQPAGLGSGGANFDAMWAGSATSAGGTNDNIMSLISGCGGGVLAYTETPINNGWRIFFCNQWTWDDGPGTSVTGIDMQGVSCHEYGHALGLGHSAVGGATMYPSISGSGVNARSIAADDIAGVQFVYGVVNPSVKPRITNAIASIGSVSITGQHFHATSNELWFTPANPTAPGSTPLVILTNVPSNGTSISATVPVSAGPGDVIVKIPGTSNDTMSNAWPVDVNECPDPSNFCVSAANSYGPGATIQTFGSTSVAANDFVLYDTGIPPGKLAIHLYGMNQIAPTPLGAGWRCIGSPFYRIYPGANAGPFGDVNYPVNLNALPAAGHISAGQTWSFMAWYRDPNFGGFFYNGTDAVQTTWCP